MECALTAFSLASFQQKEKTVASSDLTEQLAVSSKYGAVL